MNGNREKMCVYNLQISHDAEKYAHFRGSVTFDCEDHKCDPQMRSTRELIV